MNISQANLQQRSELGQVFIAVFADDNYSYDIFLRMLTAAESRCVTIVTMFVLCGRVSY